MYRRSLSIIFSFALLLVTAPAFAGDGSNLLQYVPPTSQVVAGINVDAVRGTPLWNRAMALADSDADFQRSLNTLKTDGGFDPLTAIDTIVIAVGGVSARAAENSVAIIEVDYPAEGLTKVLTDDGYTASADAGVTWFQKGEEAVAYLAPNIVAFGRTAMVQGAIASANGQEGGPTGTVAQQIAAVDTSGAIWMAAQLPAGSQGAQAARLALNLSSGAQATVNVVMESAEAAGTAVTEFNTQIAAVSGSPEVEALGLTPVVTGLQAAASGSDVSVTLSIDAETWATLVQRLGDLAAEEIR